MLPPRDNILDISFHRRLITVGGLIILFTLFLFTYLCFHLYSQNLGDLELFFFISLFFFEFGLVLYIITYILKPLFELNRGFRVIVEKKTRDLSEYKKAIDASVLVSKTDPDGLITYVNDKFCSVSGYTKKELIGKNHNIIRHPDTPTELFKNLWDAVKEKHIWSGVIKNKKKDGGFYWVHSTIIPILDNTGEIIEYLSIRSDITALKEAEEKLSKSYEKLQEFNTALENISSTIIITAYDGVIEYVNTAFERNTGYTKEEAIGKNSTLLQSKYPNSAIYEQIKNTIHSGEIWTGELLNKKKNGEEIYEKVTISPVFNTDGSFHKFITVKVDITDEVQLSKNLTESYKKLIELDKKKDEFVSIASHELKTPLSVIKGYVSLFLSGSFGEMNEKQKEYLERIFKSSNQLLTLIQDMLDLSKLKSGKTRFHFSSFSLEVFLENIKKEFSFMYEEKQVTFIVENKSLNKELYNDENRLRQIIVNLLSNAYKFTKSGGMVVLLIQEYNDDYLQFSVKDNGIGIPQEKIKIIFDQFSQVENHLQRDYQGTGLGLTIVKDIIDKLGGKIWVESKEGEGSQFTFALPKNPKLL